MNRNQEEITINGRFLSLFKSSGESFTNDRSLLKHNELCSTNVVVGQNVDRQNVDRHNVEQTKCRTDKMSTNKMANRQNVNRQTVEQKNW